jgi:hypothetical protein
MRGGEIPMDFEFLAVLEIKRPIVDHVDDGLQRGRAGNGRIERYRSEGVEVILASDGFREIGNVLLVDGAFPVLLRRRGRFVAGKVEQRRGGAQQQVCGSGFQNSSGSSECASHLHILLSGSQVFPFGHSAFSVHEMRPGMEIRVTTWDRRTRSTWTSALVPVALRVASNLG